MQFKEQIQKLTSTVFIKDMPEYIYKTVASVMSNLTSIATIGVEAWIGKIKGLREKILRGTNWLENRGCARRAFWQKLKEVEQSPSDEIIDFRIQ